MHNCCHIVGRRLFVVLIIGFCEGNFTSERDYRTQVLMVVIWYDERGVETRKCESDGTQMPREKDAREGRCKRGKMQERRMLIVAGIHEAHRHSG